MNAPQWKTEIDSPGLWIIELSGLKTFQAIEVTNFEAFNFCFKFTRAYGPIPLETTSQDAPGSTIDRSDDNQPGKSNRNALQQTETAGAPKTNEQSIADLSAISEAHKKQIDELAKQLERIDRYALARAIGLLENIKQHTEQIRELEKNDELENRTAAGLSTRIDCLRHEFAGMERTPAATIKRITEIENRLNLHEKDLAEILTDNAEADKKILANAGAIARIVRHLDRLPEEMLRKLLNQTKEKPARDFSPDGYPALPKHKPAPDITEPTATAWNTNPTIDQKDFM